MGVYGADVAELRDTAGQFEQSAERLGSLRRVLDAQIARSPWTGQDAEQFRQLWRTACTPGLVSAVDRLTEAVAALRRNADDQETTSAARGGAPGTSGASGSSAGGSDPSSPPSSGGADAVQRWWEGLTAEERAELIADDPLRWGNADGVPVADRVAANQLTAEERLGQSGLSADERDYLEAVVAGDRALVLYDPAGERVIEMVGTLGPDTTDVIVYVPGTDADMQSFFGGSVQQVGTYLTDRDTSGGTVAFIAKDGPWAEWNPFSDRSNASEDFALSRGEGVAGFIGAVQGEAGDVRTTAIAHSAGMSVVSGSEVAGAEYDNVLSLGGSWLAPGWEARPGTDYHHYQYGVDAINYLDPFKDTPHESADFDQNVYAPDTFEVLGVPIQNEGANHGRIAEGARTNQEALNDMYRDIHR